MIEPIRAKVKSLCLFQGYLVRQPCLRFVARNPSFSLLAPSAPRTQVPFLHPPADKSALSVPTAKGNRFISTERKARWKARMRWQLRFHAYFWPATILLTFIGFGAHQTYLESKYPTPPELSFWTRWAMRSTMAREFEPFSRLGNPVVDWPSVGRGYTWLMYRMTNPDKDGQSMAEQLHTCSVDSGAECPGYDVTLNSEPWRRAYFQVLMGTARAAERLEGYVLDRSRRLVYPGDMVIGPSNPRPKPKPYGWKDPPREEDCIPAYESPQTSYTRILNTKGLSTKQRIDAALAFADWLDFKALASTAEDMYLWAIDIAAEALPPTSRDVVDRRTGVLKHNFSASPSENILRACTALGVHYASLGNVQAALPVLVSLLQARKKLPHEPAAEDTLPLREIEDGVNRKQPFLRTMEALLSGVPYPPAPPSGNEPPLHTLSEACEEIGLMTYIGEILFATSSKESGLSWTRDAVDAAEAVMWIMKERKKEDGQERCQECLAAGLNNWKKMAKSMAAVIGENSHQSSSSTTTGVGLDPETRPLEQNKRWEEELTQIELRIQKTAPLLASPGKSQVSRWIV